MHAPRPRRGRSRPLGLLGMLGLVALLEATIARLEPDCFTTNIAASWRQAGRAASREAAEARVLGFGDSMVMYGVAPRAIEGVAGEPAYNLAPLGGRPEASYFLLRRALRAGARPRAVLFNCMPHPIHGDVRSSLRFWQEIASPAEAFEMARAEGDASLFAELMAGRALASFRTRHEVRASLRAALGGASYSATIGANVAPMRHNWRANRGGQLLARNPSYDGAPNRGDRALNPSTFRPNPTSIYYLNKFLDLMSDRGIPAYWLLTPIAPASQSAREETGLEAAYEGIIRDLQGRYPNVVVLDGRHSGYDARVFSDSVHLDREGALAYSEDLGAILRGGGPGRSRWVAMPRFRPRPGGPSLLDVDQSRMVLISRGGERR